MILDGHIHVRRGARCRDEFRSRLAEAGVDGGAVISPPPPVFNDGEPQDASQRLDEVLYWTEGGENLYSLLWIDPVAEGACDEVALGCERGVTGFKVICNTHYPGDERALDVYRAIAAADKPLLFHSGILWDGQPSSPYNRPAAFEELLVVKGLKFAMAHISWPWCDELIAVYGKLQNAGSCPDGRPPELFVDTTPGTPPIYRDDALRKLFTVGYDVEHNVMFGTDCNTEDYNVQWAKEWIARDMEIFSRLGLSHETVEGVFSENLRRFLGVSDVKVDKKPLIPGR